MKHTLIPPPRGKVHDLATLRLEPLVTSPRSSSVAGLSIATTSGSTQRRLHSLERAATLINSVHGKVVPAPKGSSQKRKFPRQNSLPEESLLYPRMRRDDIIPTSQPDQVEYDRWFIQPRATWKVRWDLWIGFIITYSVILIPYRIGFGIELAGWEQVMNYCFDSSFAIDVILNFFTGYYDEDVLVYELRKVRQRYIRSWFIFDVASTVPLDQFLQVVTHVSSSLLSLKLIRVFRLFRLFKLMRLLRLKRAIEAVQMNALNAHVLQTTKSLLIIIFIIHLVSCGWYMFYTWDPSGPNWVTNIEPNGFESPYLVSFYWVSNTMMSVGYGDIYGVNDGERLYSIFVACIGSICVGMIIANIQMLTENYNPRSVMLKQKLQDAKEFLIKRGIPRRLRHRVISQFEFHWSHRTTFDEETLLQQFPKSLQYEILAASMESFVKKFPFFGMASVDFFLFVIPRLRPIVLGPGQELVDAESVWEELYFLTSGTVETLQSNLVVGSLFPGDICGVEYLVKGRQRYTYTYRSISKTEMYALYSKDLLEAIKKCPVARKYLQDLATIFGERYEESARRGMRALQRQRSLRAIDQNASLKREPYLHKRHRTSVSPANTIHAMTSEFISRMNIPIAGDEIMIHWSIIRHYAVSKILWDIVMGITVSVTVIVVPFRIAFDDQDSVVSYAFDRISDVLFVMDVFLSFFTTYVDDTGVEILDRYEIRRHYLKSAFFVDIISTVPFDFILEAVAVGNIFKSLRLFRTLKLTKLLRLTRLSKVLKTNSQWIAELDVNADTVRLLRLLAPVMIIAHYVGCIWYFISADRAAKDAWWGRIYFEYPDSIRSKYIASIYWAITTMTTVGFGDIYAVNDYEKGFSIFVLIGGTTLFAYVVGTVIEVANNSKSLMNREHETVQRVNAYVKERGISPDFMMACQEHLRFVEAEKTFFAENALLDALSYSLRSELILMLNGGIMSKVRFFDKKPKWFLTLLLPRLVPQFFLEGDILVYQDNPVSGIFFIISGAVIAKTRRAEPNGTTGTTGTRQSYDDAAEHQSTIARISEGEFFGYKETLTETVAQYNLFALKATGTYLLSRECLDDVERQYPQVTDEIRSLFIQSIMKQQTVVSGWQNNDIIGLTTEDRNRIVELNIARRCSNIDSIRESVNGVSMFGRRHSSLIEIHEDSMVELATNTSTAVTVTEVSSGASDSSESFNDDEEQSALQLSQKGNSSAQAQKAADATRVSTSKTPGLVTHSGPACTFHKVPLTELPRLSETSTMQQPSEQFPNAATILSETGNSSEANQFRPERSPAFRYSTMPAQFRRGLSERYATMRKHEVTALVDTLLSEQGYLIHRTASS